MRIVRRHIDPKEIEEGAFYDEAYFTTRVRGDTDFYVNGRLLFSFRKKVVDNGTWLPIAEAHLKKPILTSNNRRMAGDDPRKRVNSGIVGYFDRLTPQMKCRHGLSEAGRPTASLTRYPTEWGIIQPFFRELDRWYKKTSPRSYRIQENAVREVAPALRIPGTVFTTVTIDRDWRTAAHTDKGDFKEALSCIAFLGKNIQGGYFGFPQYRLLVETEPGDAVLMDPHEAHCNTELGLGGKGSRRFSFVCYLRDGMRGLTEPIACGDQVWFVRPKDGGHSS